VNDVAARARLWQAAQVADRLAMTPAAFNARRRRLEADHGFPPPVPGLGRRWNPAAIEGWLAALGGGFPPTDPANPEEILISRARAMVAA
jgi:hypothetical protein